MPDKPTTRHGYTDEQLALVRETCLYVATKLGDLMDEIVVVGGLVPPLIIDQEDLPDDVDLHVGTLDLDVGLTISLLDEGHYRTLTERLRRAGFSQDENDNGWPTRQRWKIKVEGKAKVTVDFLIPPSLPDDEGGRIRDIEPDFAAIIAPGLHLAFRERRRVTISGETIVGETATRDVWVCGPGAFIVLKALAFDSRGENKDAYDLFYVIRNYGDAVEDVLACFRPLLLDPDGAKALDVLRRDFLDQDALGPRRVAEFLTRGPDDVIQADVAGFVKRLVEGC
jgi:hypothetical protein